MNGGNREAPIEAALRELMRDIGMTIGDAQREDMMAAMKEFIEANEAQIRMEKRREKREAAKRKKT